VDLRDHLLCLGDGIERGVESCERHHVGDDLGALLHREKESKWQAIATNARDAARAPGRTGDAGKAMRVSPPDRSGCTWRALIAVTHPFSGHTRISGGPPCGPA